jgi:hypothetical protein
MLVHRATADFWRLFEQLPSDVRSRAEKQFALLKADVRHPSLHFKAVKMQHGEELWSARVSLYYRALALRRPNGYLWIWIGDHKAYDLLIA